MGEDYNHIVDCNRDGQTKTCQNMDITWGWLLLLKLSQEKECHIRLYRLCKMLEGMLPQVGMVSGVQAYFIQKFIPNSLAIGDDGNAILYAEGTKDLGYM